MSAVTCQACTEREETRLFITHGTKGAKQNEKQKKSLIKSHIAGGNYPPCSVFMLQLRNSQR